MSVCHIQCPFIKSTLSEVVSPKYTRSALLPIPNDSEVVFLDASLSIVSHIFSAPFNPQVSLASLLLSVASLRRWRP